jgi:hypothetical protein
MNRTLPAVPEHSSRLNSIIYEKDILPPHELTHGRDQMDSALSAGEYASVSNEQPQNTDWRMVSHQENSKNLIKVIGMDKNEPLAQITSQIGFEESVSEERLKPMEMPPAFAPVARTSIERPTTAFHIPSSVKDKPLPAPAVERHSLDTRAQIPQRQSSLPVTTRLADERLTGPAVAHPLFNTVAREVPKSDMSNQMMNRRASQPNIITSPNN